MFVQMTRAAALCLASAIAVTSQSAAACSRIPLSRPLQMTPAEIDAQARNLMAGASAVIEGTVTRIPTRIGADGSGAGEMRVDRIIFGQAPATISLGRTMCNDFEAIGQRGIVVVRADMQTRYWLHPQLVEAIARIAAARQGNKRLERPPEHRAEKWEP